MVPLTEHRFKSDSTLHELRPVRHIHSIRGTRHMERDEAIELLRSGPEGVRKWNALGEGPNETVDSSKIIIPGFKFI